MPSIVAILLIIILHTLHIVKYWDKLSVVAEKYHDVFWHNWSLSGYDLHTYSTVSHWDVLYEVYRHPLMAFFMWAPATVNEFITGLTGTNHAIIIVGVIWAVFAFYGFLFMLRIFREVMGLRMRSALLLCALFYSMGYTMLSIFVPDHFGPSMAILVMTVYVASRRMAQHREMTTWETVLLFLVTAGITLSNGVKVFLAALFTQRCRFFRPRRLVVYALASALLFGIAYVQEQTFVIPRQEVAKAAAREKGRQERMALLESVRDTMGHKGESACRREVNRIMQKRAEEKYRWNHKQMWNVNKGKSMGDGKFSSWTDVSTPRWASAVENLFGESVQYHENPLFGDALANRPAIVAYSNPVNYIAETIIVLLMFAGIIVGRRDRVVQLSLSFFAFDMFIHFVLGFGLNEIYIMSPHFLFVIPICIASLLRNLRSKVSHRFCLLTIGALTLWLAYWNLSLLLGFLLGA